MFALVSNRSASWCPWIFLIRPRERCAMLHSEPHNPADPWSLSTWFLLTMDGWESDATNRAM
jgi:hypothetical protein